MAALLCFLVVTTGNAYSVSTQLQRNIVAAGKKLR